MKSPRKARSSAASAVMVSTRSMTLAPPAACRRDHSLRATRPAAASHAAPATSPSSQHLQGPARRQRLPACLPACLPAPAASLNTDVHKAANDYVLDSVCTCTAVGIAQKRNAKSKSAVIRGAEGKLRPVNN